MKKIVTMIASASLAVMALTVAIAQPFSRSSAEYYYADAGASEAAPPEQKRTAQPTKPAGGTVDTRDTEVIPSVGIGVSGKVDVALAQGKTVLGSSAFNMSNMEDSLRKWFNTKESGYTIPNAELLTWAQNAKNPDNTPKYGGVNAPMLPNEDLYLSFAQTVSLSSQGEFDWWIYDHSRTANINNSNHTYIEAQGASENSNQTKYYNNARHVVLGNSSSGINDMVDFYGYGVYGYKDFLYLPNDQPAKKTFEFAIQEQEGTHTLDGVGFFFNCYIYGGNYVSGSTNPQRMDGYLLLLGYTSANSATGKSIQIIKFKGLNTYTFHHSWESVISDMAINNTNPLGATSSEIVATSTQYNLGTTPKISRRIKIEVDPDYVKMWHRGAVNNSSYLTTSFADLSETDQNAAVITFNLKSGGTANTVTLDKSFINAENGYGFGPIGSYRSHACTNSTWQQFQRLTMSMEKVRKLREVVADPDWHDNTQPFLLNLNMQAVEDFDDPSLESDLLARMINDNVYYIGLCSNLNETESGKFVNATSAGGSLVNVEKINVGGTAISTASRDKQLFEVAKIIYDQWYKQNTDNRVLVNTPVSLEVSPSASASNTADYLWPNGKWMFKHNTPQELGWDVDLSDPDNTTTNALADIRMTNLQVGFTSPGTYDIYYRDTKVSTITAHRKPVASFTINISDLNAPKFTNTSYDPDDLSAGIVDSVWRITDVTAGTSPDTITLTGPPALTPNHSYMVDLTVTDKWGASTTYARNFLATSTPTEPPTAAFTLTPHQVIKNMATAEITITEGSTDQYGEPLASTYTWDGGTPANAPSITGSGNYSVKDMAVGAYKVKLDVETTTDHRQSVQTANQQFDLVLDQQAPTATAVPAPGTTGLSGVTTITLTYKDPPDAANKNVAAGLKHQWIYVSATQVNPSDITDAQWGAASPLDNRAQELPFGTSYVYYKAEDKTENAPSGKGNISAALLGSYNVSQLATNVVLTAAPNSQDFTTPGDPSGTIILTATLDPSDNAYVGGTGTIEFFMDGVSLGFADITKGVSGGKYTAYATFETPVPARAAYAAHPDGTMTFTAVFLGDDVHGSGTGNLNNYVVNPSNDATITVTAEGKTYDGTTIAQPYYPHTYPQGAGNYTGADKSISYSGLEYGTDAFGPSTAGPVNVGNYTVDVATLNPHYVQKTATANFTIVPRQLTIEVEADNQSPQMNNSIEFTATVNNIVSGQTLQGTIKFLIDGVPVATGLSVVSASATTGEAKYQWTANSGNHTITAVYTPAAKDNYTDATGTLSGYSVGKTGQSGLSGGPYTVTYGGPKFTIAATGGTGSGAITYKKVADASNGDGDCVVFNPYSQEITIKSTGTAYIEATKAADGQYNATSAIIKVTVNPATNTVVATVADITYGQGFISPVVTQTASPAAELTYKYNGTTYGGATYGPTSVAPTLAGTYTLDVDAAATITHTAASAPQVSFTIHRAPQTPLVIPDTLIYTNQSPFYLPLTGGSGNGAVTWSLHAEDNMVTINTSNQIVRTANLPSAGTPPEGIDTVIVWKAQSDNYLISDPDTAIVRVQYEPAGVPVLNATIPPDFNDAGYEWQFTLGGHPSFTIPNPNSIPGWPAWLQIESTPAQIAAGLIILKGTPSTINGDDGEYELNLPVTNFAGTVTVPIKFTVYKAPVMILPEDSVIDVQDNLVVVFPIKMNTTITGTAKLNNRVVEGFWSSDTTFVVLHPEPCFEYKTIYTLKLDDLRDADGAIVHYSQTFPFRTGDPPPTPELRRNIKYVLPDGVIASPNYTPLYVMSGDDFEFTLDVPDDKKPEVLTDRYYDQKREMLIGVPDANVPNRYSFVVSEIHHHVVITVALTPKSDNEIVDVTRLWSYGGRLYINAGHAGTLEVYTLAGALTLQRDIPAGDTSFPLQRGAYIVRLNGKTFKVIVN